MTTSEHAPGGHPMTIPRRRIAPGQRKTAKKTRQKDTERIHRASRCATAGPCLSCALGHANPPVFPTTPTSPMHGRGRPAPAMPSTTLDASKDEEQSTIQAMEETSAAAVPAAGEAASDGACEAAGGEAEPTRLAGAAGGGGSGGRGAAAAAEPSKGAAAAAADPDAWSEGVAVRDRQERGASVGDRARRGGNGKRTGAWPVRARIRVRMCSAKEPSVNWYPSTCRRMSPRKLNWRTP